MAEQGSPSFSRPAESAPREKCDERLDVPLPADVKGRAARISAVRGFQSVSAWARSVLEHELLAQEQEIDRIVAATGGDANWRKRG